MRAIKTGAFTLEGLNSFAVTFYFYYFYFFMEKQFDFGNKANLTLAALGGLVCIPAAFYGGRFAQRAGYFTALKSGFGIMVMALTVGWLIAESPAAHIAVMLVTNIGMCLTWPTLEALVSEGETYDGLKRNIGIYNTVWAGTNALAYFVGGAMLDKLSFKCLFVVPITLLVVQLALTFRLQQRTKFPASIEGKLKPTAPVRSAHPHPAVKTRTFMRMAWLANPFAYIAINTLVAVMPGVANRLQLSTTLAGFCCSVWCFARLGAFLGLWFWDDWHYKFRWLLAAYLALIASFMLVLTVPNLIVVLAAQLAFGGAIGLIYYSSLFYSMDVGDTKGEHGGIHEAAIGLGNFAGPAVGALSLQFSPVHVHGGAGAVSVALVFGLFALLTIQWRSRRRN